MKSKPIILPTLRSFGAGLRAQNASSFLETLNQWAENYNKQPHGEQLRLKRKSAHVFRKVAQGALKIFVRKGKETQPDILKILNHLDEYLSAREIHQVVVIAIKAWTGATLEVRQLLVQLLCDLLYEAARHEKHDQIKEDVVNNDRERIFNHLFTQLCSLMGKRLKEDQATAHFIFENLLTFASGLRPQDSKQLFDELSESTQKVKTSRSNLREGLLGKRASSPPYIRRIGKEFLGQMRLFEKFSKMSDLPGNITPIVTIMSRKGGVGKTLIALTIALALAKAGKRVALIDFDIGGPSLSYCFEMKEHASSLVTLEQAFIPGGPDFRCSIGELLATPNNIEKLGIVEGNLLVAQMGPFATDRHELLYIINSQRFDEMHDAMRDFVSALSEKVDVIIFDNHPGLWGPSLITFGFAYQQSRKTGAGMTLYVTSTDVIDIAGMTIELDLFRSLGVLDNELAFRWIINKCPRLSPKKSGAESAAIFEDPVLLADALRHIPALHDVPNVSREKAILRYSLPGNRILIYQNGFLGTFFRTQNRGGNLPFDKLLSTGRLKSTGLAKIIDIVESLV